MDEWTDGWINQQLDGWMDGCVDYWLKKQLRVWLKIFLCLCVNIAANTSSIEAINSTAIARSTLADIAVIAAYATAAAD